MFFNDIWDDIFQALLERKKSSGSSGEDLFKPYVEGILTELTAKDLKGLTEVPDGAFFGTGVTSITLPDGVTSIGEDAFRQSESLKVLVIPDSVTSIGKRALMSLKLTDLTIGKGVTTLPSSVFCYTYVTNLYYSGDLVSWCNIDVTDYDSTPDPSNFYLKNDSGEYELITNLVIPDGITEIKPRAFSSFYGLTGLIIPDSVTTIGEYAFSSLFNVTNAVVGRGVTSIGRSGLCCGSSVSYGSQYVEITFLCTTPPVIQSDSFTNIRYMDKIIVPKGCGEAYKTATNWTKYADLIEEATE